MHTSVTFNGYFLPSEIVCGIIRQSDYGPYLKYICKGFADHFFEAFLQDCVDSPSLKDRVTYIQHYWSFSAKQKIEKLYQWLRQDIANTGSGLLYVEVASREEMLKLKCTSIEKLHQLDSYLEDAGLIKLFEHHASEILGAKDWLASLKEKGVFEKAKNIRQRFFSYQEDLKVITEMDCNAWRFTKLPKEMGLFTHLQELNLANNPLISLPKELGYLSQLQELNLHNNQLVSLQGASSLISLQTLVLSGNRLKSVPPEIFNLNQLTRLCLADNCLSSLPKEIQALSQLRDLSLTNYGQASYAKRFGGLNQYLLRSSSNHLSSVPEEISSLQHLERLDLAHNQLESVPKGIGSLKQLKYLSLENNWLTNLPEEMEKLSQLQRLNIKHNPFTSLPQWVNRLIETGIAIR